MTILEEVNNESSRRVQAKMEYIIQNLKNDIVSQGYTALKNNGTYQTGINGGDEMELRLTCNAINAKYEDIVASVNGLPGAFTITIEFK